VGAIVTAPVQPGEMQPRQEPGDGVDAETTAPDRSLFVSRGLLRFGLLPGHGYAEAFVGVDEVVVVVVANVDLYPVDLAGEAA
jgi:hypothetical protein